MHLLSQGPTQLAAPAALPLVAGGLLPNPGSMVAGMGELLLTRSLKVAAVVLGAVVLNRLVRWLLRRLVRGLEHRYIQQPLESLRAKTPRALLASTDPLPSLRRSQRAEMIGAALANVASVAIWLVAAILVLHALGLRLGPLLAGAGLAGLVLSLSAQQMVRDFLSGIAMLMEDQYGLGDVVDAGPAKGVVERVGLRTTRLRAVDGIVWHVRNGEIERLGNESRTGPGCWSTWRWPAGPTWPRPCGPSSRPPKRSPATSSGSRSCWRPRKSGGWRRSSRPRSPSAWRSRPARPSATTSPASCAPAWRARWSKPASPCRRWPRASWSPPAQTAPARRVPNRSIAWATHAGRHHEDDPSA